MDPVASAPHTDAELRWAWRMSGLPVQGISFEQATASPALLAVLQLGVARQRRKRARLQSTTLGAGIERSQPGFSASAQQ
ncbi:hypothetical protein [Thauera butanivorans]|uniref:hypothetical protein n=1 Tax=Thauera butanivorans TaxID=86174 RepID=UPI00083833FA|nr:hypothetical protein [Thauera butanivorans]